MMTTDTYIQKASDAAAVNRNALTSMLDISLGATQKLLELNGEFVLSLARSDGAMKGDFDFNNPVGLQAQRLERTTEYLRDLNDICLSAQSEIAKLNTQQAENLMQVITTQLDAFAKTDPRNTAAFSEMLKTAFSKTETTYEEMINTTRELTESSLNAALSALQPAARETSRKVASPKKTH